MLFILGLSILVLVFNTGFRNAFYQATWIVKLPDSATEEYINGFSSSTYLAALDKQNKELHWQGIPEVVLNRTLEGIRSQFGDQTVTVTEVTELLAPAVYTRIAYIVIFGLIVSLVYLYFTEIGKFNSRKIYFNLTGLNILSLVWSGVVMLGVLSSMSLIYKLTEYSLLSLVIMIIWVGIGYYLSLAQVQKELTLGLALEKQRKYWKQFNRANWNWLVLFIVLLALGLGTVFVVDGILIGIAVILGGYMQQELPTLLHRLIARLRSIRFYKSNSKFKKPAVTKPVANITKVNVSKPKKEKVKTKKTKKSKRKK